MEISETYQQSKLNLSYISVPTSIGLPVETAVETKFNPNPLISGCAIPRNCCNLVTEALTGDIAFFRSLPRTVVGLIMPAFVAFENA